MLRTPLRHGALPSPPVGYRGTFPLPAVMLQAPPSRRPVHATPSHPTYGRGTNAHESHAPREQRASRERAFERASRLQLDRVEGRHASITPPRSADLTIAQLTDLTIAQLTWLTASRTISKRSVLLLGARPPRSTESRTASASRKIASSSSSGEPSFLPG